MLHNCVGAPSGRLSNPFEEDPAWNPYGGSQAFVFDAPLPENFKFHTPTNVVRPQWQPYSPYLGLPYVPVQSHPAQLTAPSHDSAFWLTVPQPVKADITPEYYQYGIPPPMNQRPSVPVQDPYQPALTCTAPASEPPFGSEMVFGFPQATFQQPNADGLEPGSEMEMPHAGLPFISPYPSLGNLTQIETNNAQYARSQSYSSRHENSHGVFYPQGIASSPQSRDRAPRQTQYRRANRRKYQDPGVIERVASGQNNKNASAALTKALQNGRPRNGGDPTVSPDFIGTYGGRKMNKVAMEDRQSGLPERYNRRGPRPGMEPGFNNVRDQEPLQPGTSRANPDSDYGLTTQQSFQTLFGHICMLNTSDTGGVYCPDCMAGKPRAMGPHTLI